MEGGGIWMSPTWARDVCGDITRGGPASTLVGAQKAVNQRE